MTVDRSDSDSDLDHVYVVWKGPGLIPGDSDIRIMKGTEDLSQPTATMIWDQSSSQIGRVSADPNTQTYPWITWDECTGKLAVVWLDSRNPSGRETYVAVAPSRDANVSCPPLFENRIP